MFSLESTCLLFLHSYVSFIVESLFKHSSFPNSNRLCSFQNREVSSNYLLQTNVPASGEAWGAPHARALLEPQEIVPSATMAQSSVSPSPLVSQGRQANPDIQDIITGIVKLLNGRYQIFFLHFVTS